MNRIVYSKYSNERSRKFQIRTDIIEDENGKKYARKTACTEEAGEHIKNLVEISSKLDRSYEGTQLVTNKFFYENDSVVFEFLEGKTFEQILDDCLKNENYTGVVDKICGFFDVLKKTLDLKPFVVTDEFRQVYGDIDFGQNLQAADLNNIDYIFGNIFMEDDKWTVIDYEWTFDFPIPYLYIVYRAVHYYTYDSSRKAIKELGILRMLGITEQLEKCFEIMEHRFQLYILGETIPVVNMYDDIAGNTYCLDEMLECQVDNVKQNEIQVYFDYGNGFTEENSKIITPCKSDKTEKINHYEIPVSNVKMLRIDPGDEACVLSHVSMLCKGADIQTPVFMTNGMNMGENYYLFSTNDPMIVISELPENVQTIEFVCRREKLLEKTSAILNKGLNNGLVEPLRENLDVIVRVFKEEYEEKKDEIEKELNYYKVNYMAAMEQREALKREKAHLNNLLTESYAEYDRVMNSFSMKVTKPVRFGKKATKKIVKSNKFTYKCARGVKCLKENGLKYTVNRTKYKINKKFEPKTGYWRISPTEIKKQKETVFSKNIKFSIIVPLYNTPQQFLKEMIESVQGQTYGNWELCMADGSDENHAYVGKICSKYASKDKRILYRKLESNEGISENTNRCLEMATGDYIALFDHDDLLFPGALYENMCVIDKEDADFIYSDEDTFSTTPLESYCPHYKPDFSPDTLRSYNYICHFSVFKKSLLDSVGKFRKEFDGSQDYDMILRLTEKAQRIVHIPKIIYYWRAHAASVASDISAKTYCLDAAKAALDEHLARVGLKGKAQDASIPSVYKMQYEIVGEPLISIIIPNKDYIEDLSKCVNSIIEKSTYRNFEIIIVENNSELESTFEYYKEIEKDSHVKVVYWKDEFNYSAINNFGFEYTKGEYILLLNNDVEIITPDWMQEMLMFAQRKDVGAVGAKLYYPDDTIQHAGIIIGIGGVAGHSHKNFEKNAYGYSSRLQLAQNLSAVTAACMLMPKDVFKEVGGLDEGFKVAFNDVDLCMKIRKAGYLIVFTPFAELYHYESKSRGYENSPEKVARFNSEIQRFYSKWDPELEAGDPYYNPNLTLRTEDFAVKPSDEGRIRA